MAASAGRPFVAHADGLRPLVDDLLTALAGSSDRIVCLTGLPGVGKSATAQEVVRRAAPAFEDVVTVSGRESVLDLVQVIDAVYVRLPVPRERDADVSQLVDGLLDYLRAHQVLLFVDNLDGADASVIGVLVRIPEPSKVIITIRDASPMRRHLFGVLELEHPGMTTGELDELLSTLADRSPALRRKYELAARADIDRLLKRVQGWPEALILSAGRVASSVLHFADLDVVLDEADVYGSLLGNLFQSMPRTTRRCMVAASSYHSSFTAKGVAAVTGFSLRSIASCTQHLLDLHLIEELPPAHRYRAAHPIIEEFFARALARSRDPGPSRASARDHLIAWAREHGGQPRADWSNFALLDLEFPNLPPLMTVLWHEGDARRLTELYRYLFSYIVERGYWTFTEMWCERVIAIVPPRAYRVDWLIWWSWIKFYLREDYAGAARLAEDALSLQPRLVRQRFEAHRRALVAYGRLFDAEAVRAHRDGAERSCRGGTTSNERIDLNNSLGDAVFHLALAGVAEFSFDAAYSFYESAEHLARTRADPNTREIGIAQLGQARALLAFGDLDRACRVALAATDLAQEIAWLRGLAEGHALLAEIFDAMGDAVRATTARSRANDLRSQLRSAEVL